MKLRKLENKDAQYMFEWMMDDTVVHDMGTKFSSKTIEDCYFFIQKSLNEFEVSDMPKNLHLAIVNDDDEYMGTVSLKDIDLNTETAEFAITIRKSAMGLGFSKFAMREIIHIGFSQIRLKKIFWYVSKSNSRAIKFYDKLGYQRVKPDLNELRATILDPNKLIWYEIVSKS